MAKEKAPAYQWYPKDFESDEHVKLMTMEQEGIYRRLLDHCWLHGSIPADMRAMGAICKNTPERKMVKVWAAISPCFHPHPDERGRYVNRRIERQRARHEAFCAKQAEAGRKSGEARRAASAQNRTTVEPPFESGSGLVRTKTNSASASPLGLSIESPSVQKGPARISDVLSVVPGGNRAS